MMKAAAYSARVAKKQFKDKRIRACAEGIINDKLKRKED